MRSPQLHCTGEPTFAALKKTFGDRYIYAGLGMTLGVGANPRVESESRPSNALTEDDLRGYRELLAQSDDLEDGGSGPHVQRNLESATAAEARR
jgi:hypothetical protein